MHSMKPAIALQHVAFSYGRRRVLEQADLVVEHGETVVLLGANGAGKSTLLRLCLGTLRTGSGRLNVLGQDPLRRRGAFLQRVGYVPDRPDAYAHMTAREWLRFLAPHYRRWSEPRVQELMERWSVPEATPFRSMSRGEAMKAMLVSALAHDPDLLLLDEPFGGLDPFAREELLRGVVQSMSEERRARPRTVLLTTHDLDVVRRLEDRVVMLANGVLREVEPGVPRTAEQLREWTGGGTPALTPELIPSDAR